MLSDVVFEGHTADCFIKISHTELMDVLRPQIIKIGNRCYRKNPSLQNDVTDEEESWGSEDVVQNCDWNDEACDTQFDIVETDKGFEISLDIPSTFFKHIIGKKGETRRRLENETKTQIKIPKSGQEGPIIVAGHDKQGVISAKTRIDVIIDTARQREPFTHFLSFPVTSEAVKCAFTDFKSDVLRQCDSDRGIDATIFQNPDKLHLTIGTLVLLNDTEIEHARTILQNCLEDLIRPILKDKPLISRVKGLEYMNDDPNNVDVLYAKVELIHDPERLQILVDRLVDKFTASGFMQREHDHVKLHITVMNTLMRKDPSGAPLPWKQDRKGDIRKDRESFNAVNVMKKFKDYDFGELHINKLHLSQRYGTDCTGYYASAGSIKLP